MSAGAIVSVTSELLTEPETPVTTVSVPNSMLAVTFLRLLWEAPTILSAPRPGFLRSRGTRMSRRPVR